MNAVYQHSLASSWVHYISIGEDTFPLLAAGLVDRAFKRVMSHIEKDVMEEKLNTDREQ